MLILASVVMPWLAKQKRRLSAATGSAALRADAAESGYGHLALIALAGLAINAIWKVSSADPVAALMLLPQTYDRMGYSTCYSRSLGRSRKKWTL
jgi:divalent metal cation (Fe/Co/Zn/Cd) transporter